jgi:GT2 family glycosyltransferase
VRALPSCATPAVAIRRSILDKVGLFDTEMKYFEDVDLFLRVAEEGAVARSQEALVLIHDRPDSLSHAAALTPERSAHAADMVFRLTFKALLRNKTPRDRDGALSAAYQSAGIYAFERGDMRLARRYFRIALLLEFSRQGLVLYLRSWTPRWINALARRLKNRRLVRK